MGVEPTTLKRTDLQSAAFADSLPTQIHAVRWKQPQTPLRLSFITLFCLSILEEPDIAPILWRDRRHHKYFLFLRCSRLMNLIHLLVERGICLLSAPLPVTALVIVKLLYWAPSTIKRTSLVEPTGLEPVTFSLQGNCAPNCATAPYCPQNLFNDHLQGRTGQVRTL